MSRLLFWLFETTPGATAADAYARMMESLLPPGRAWRLIGQSFLHKVFMACADELGRLDQRMRDLLDEADPLTVDELLPEQEAELALPSDGTLAERRARVVARLVARQRYRPADFQTSLSPLLGLAAADIKVLERTHAMASSMRDDREIFEFFVYRDPTLPGTYYLTSAQALVDTIAASHTQGYVIESIDACCDDDLSHCDADLVGT
jgi:uncharacterized protein YmfQ (DUF2313 family)